MANSCLTAACSSPLLNQAAAIVSEFRGYVRVEVKRMQEIDLFRKQALRNLPGSKLCEVLAARTWRRLRVSD